MHKYPDLAGAPLLWFLMLQVGHGNLDLCSRPEISQEMINNRPLALNAPTLEKIVQYNGIRIRHLRFQEFHLLLAVLSQEGFGF